jgi:hypothetical protein
VFSISLSAYAPQLRTERGKEESLLLVLIERIRIVRKMKRFTEEKAVKYGKIGGVVTWEWRSLRCTEVPAQSKENIGLNACRLYRGPLKALKP